MDITKQFDQSLQRILTDVAQQLGKPVDQLRLALAFSGGLDSAVMLRISSAYAAKHGLELLALHIHHGLSPNADQWDSDCRQQCAQLKLSIETARINIGSTSADGIEATARSMRYAALGGLCQSHQIDVLLTAHHQDDQAETILLQLLRGSGIAGLCGMQSLHRAPQLLANPTLFLARPMLDIVRTDIEQFAHENKISHVDDESNRDTRYRRNALRVQVMPLLAEHFPGYQTRLARSARHAQAGLTQLDQLAESDYLECQLYPDSGLLDVQQVQALSDARIDNVLRYWIAEHDCQMPSTARLAEIRKQLLTARSDAQVCVRHGEVELHRYRQQLSIESVIVAAPDAERFIWNGESELVFPRFGGRLRFVPAEPMEAGIDTVWLQNRQLELRLRQGGEKLKLAGNRPTRDMKSHFQTLGIPYWQRTRLPFVFAGVDLLYAAGVGLDAKFLGQAPQRLTLHWLADDDRHRSPH